jgi:hypothetical protein
MLCPKFSLFLVTYVPQGKALYPPIETSILRASNVFFFCFVLFCFVLFWWLWANQNGSLHKSKKKLEKHPPSNGLKYQYTTIESMLSTEETT